MRKQKNAQREAKTTGRTFTCSPNADLRMGSGEMHMTHLYQADASAILLAHGAQNIRLDVKPNAIVLMVDAGRHTLKFNLYAEGFYGAATSCEAWIR